jgi:hypothetical protein
MLPYNVERIPVQRAWETLSVEHLQELGIDPGECISSSTLTAAGILCLIQYGSHSYSALNEHHQSEELFKLATDNPWRAVTLFFPMLANRLVRAIVSWKISLLAAEQVSIL